MCYLMFLVYFFALNPNVMSIYALHLEILNKLQKTGKNCEKPRKVSRNLFRECKEILKFFLSGLRVFLVYFFALNPKMKTLEALYLEIA